jgi:niacin transporter
MGKTRRLTLSGLLLAAAVLIPQFTVHLAGADAGRIFLPMHIPVLLAGLLCGPLYGGIAGVCAPVLSSLITGGTMPAVYPMLPIMSAELLTYGVVAGICSYKLKWNPVLSLVFAMAAGRVMYGLVYWGLLLNHAGGPFRALSVWAAAVTGIPGIAIQLAVVPAIMIALKKYVRLHDEACPAAKTVKQRIQSGEITCAALKDGKIIYQGCGKGVSPLIDLYENNREILCNAYFLDKVIGKAAAMILVLSGVKKIYGVKMSKSAADYLKTQNIKTGCGEKVGMILNMAGTGICPLENAVLGIHDPAEGYAKITETLAELRTKSKHDTKTPITSV